MDIIAKLKELGIETTDAMIKAFTGDFVAKAELDKKVSKAESERDNFKKQLDTANETLKSFDGIDAEKVKQQIADYGKKVKDMEDTHKKELYDRDFDDALTKSISEFKFTSEYAKKAVVEEIKAAGLKLVDGKIVGLNDTVELIKGKDDSAFLSNEEAGKAKFSTDGKGGDEPITGDPNTMDFDTYRKWRKQQEQ